MEPSRREILILGALTVAGCGHRESPTPAAPTSQSASQPATEPAAESVVDAGPLADYPADGVYDAFRDQGLFLIRRDGRLWALSSVCTHKGCKVRAQEDRSFFCRCHKSSFDPDGNVTGGPAPRPLPRFAVALSNDQHVLVNLAKPAEPAKT